LVDNEDLRKPEWEAAMLIKCNKCYTMPKNPVPKAVASTVIFLDVTG